MTNKQVKMFFLDKKETPCPLTEALIKAGYQQKRTDYISYAYESNITVDYTKAKPTQWWHLIKSWSARSKPNATFGKNIKCGELYFWMAEVSKAFSIEELTDLKNKALELAIANTPNNKKPLRTVESNIYIRDYCFDRIIEAVETYCKNIENSNDNIKF